MTIIITPPHDGPTFNGRPILEEITLAGYRVLRMNGPDYVALDTSAPVGSAQARPLYLTDIAAWKRLVWGITESLNAKPRQRR
jgi:hypothetical protein